MSGMQWICAKCSRDMKDETAAPCSFCAPALPKKYLRALVAELVFDVKAEKEGGGFLMPPGHA